jgi:hypothetical protein
MDFENGGWMLCASLTKGYVPSHALYDMDQYAFQARLNNDSNYVYERDAPARNGASWDASETLNYGQFCRAVSGASQTRVHAQLFDFSNNGSSYRGRAYDQTRSGVFAGNVFTEWFTNANSGSFTHQSGDNLTICHTNNGYGGSYQAKSVGWNGGNDETCGGAQPYTQSSNPWNDGGGGTNHCNGCTSNGNGYNTLPYGQTTILNDLSHSFWDGIDNKRWGWSDCTANGNCNYHESGYGVWLFYVR